MPFDRKFNANFCYKKACPNLPFSPASTSVISKGCMLFAKTARVFISFLAHPCCAAQDALFERRFFHRLDICGGCGGFDNNELQVVTADGFGFLSRQAMFSSMDL